MTPLLIKLFGALKSAYSKQPSIPGHHGGVPVGGLVLAASAVAVKSDVSVSVPATSAVAVKSDVSVSVPATSAVDVKSDVSVSVPATSAVDVKSDVSVSVPATSAVDVKSDVSVSVPATSAVDVKSDVSVSVPATSAVDVKSDVSMSVPATSAVDVKSDVSMSVPATSAVDVKSDVSMSVPATSAVDVKSDVSMSVPATSGASAGIGEGTAVLFAKLGCHLTLTGRNQDRLKAVVQRCVEAGCPADKVVAVTGNIQDKAVQQELLDKTLATFGRLDILVNNAGLTYWMSTSVFSDKEYNEIMDVNLKACYFLSRLVVPELTKTKGNIVNVSSVGSIRPMMVIDVYCMGKAAMNTFTQTLAREIAPCGVRVNSVLPGAVDSLMCLRGPRGFSQEQYAKLMEDTGKATPLGRVGQPEDVANVIAFLASDMSRFTTGTLVVADGGAHLTF